MTVVAAFTAEDERFLEAAAKKEQWNTDDTVLRLLAAYREIRTEYLGAVQAAHYALEDSRDQLPFDKCDAPACLRARRLLGLPDARSGRSEDK